MARGLDYRAIGTSGLIVPTPLYVDDALLAKIVNGEEASRWAGVRRIFERQGMRSAVVDWADTGHRGLLRLQQSSSLSKF